MDKAGDASNYPVSVEETRRYPTASEKRSGFNSFITIVKETRHTHNGSKKPWTSRARAPRPSPPAGPPGFGLRLADRRS